MNNINKEDKKWLKKQCKDGVEYLDGLARDNLENGYTTNNINKVLEEYKERMLYIIKEKLVTKAELPDFIIKESGLFITKALQDDRKEVIEMIRKELNCPEISIDEIHEGQPFSEGKPFIYTRDLDSLLKQLK